MEVCGCLGGGIKVNIVGIAAVKEAMAVGTGLDGHVAWVDSCMSSCCGLVCGLGAGDDH
jgi:hypothetical protein